MFVNKYVFWVSRRHPGGVSSCVFVNVYFVCYFLTVIVMFAKSYVFYSVSEFAKSKIARHISSKKPHFNFEALQKTM